MAQRPPTSGGYDIIAIVHAMHVAIAVVDGWFTSGVASIVDVLRTAEALRPTLGPTLAPITFRLLGDRSSVASAASFTIRTDGSLTEFAASDVAIVGALGATDPRDLLDALSSAAGRRLVHAIAGAHADVQLAAACTGTFALAEAGVLDGRAATTSWWLGSAFRQRYRSVRLQMDSMVVVDGSVRTAGAAFAHIDLALSLVRTVSPDLARQVAEFLVVDLRPAQSSYVAISQIAAADDVVEAFERFVRSHLADPFDVSSAAAAIGASRRTLERRTRDAVGLSPIGLVHRIRVDTARHLLATTTRSTERVANDVGYASASTLRTLLRRYPTRS
jgi:transcriptional regulator GlxA family with amidase domain